MTDRANVFFSSEKSDWGTPQPLFDHLHRIHRFEIDVCATAENAKCPLYITPEEDALSVAWRGKCWMNPPYGRGIGVWVEKAWQEAMSKSASTVCLLPANTDTRWWHDFCIWGEITFIKGRLTFEGAPNVAPFASAIVVFNAGLPPRRRAVHWGLGIKFGRSNGKTKAG